MDNPKPEKDQFRDPLPSSLVNDPGEFPSETYKTIEDLDSVLGLDPGAQVPIISDKTGCSIGVMLLAIAFALGSCIGFVMAYWSLQ